MPPRFAYWTIILDGQPTAFRAAEYDELLPTLKQLQSRNPAAAMKWFAHGRLWESREEMWQLVKKLREEAREKALKEKRGREWRPGGQHKDPREKFKRETFQARKRRDKKAANLAGGAAGRGFPGPSKVEDGPARKRTAGARDFRSRPDARQGAGRGPAKKASGVARGFSPANKGAGAGRGFRSRPEARQSAGGNRSNKGPAAGRGFDRGSKPPRKPR